MGIGAALIFPATLAILTNVFTEPTERAKAIGAWAAVSGLAVAFGPITGGFLLEHFWWGSVFLVNVPIVIVALVAGALLVPTSRDPEVGRFDVLGMLLSISAVGLLVLTVIEGPHWGWTSTATLAGFAGAVLLGAAFVLWELRVRHAAPRRPGLPVGQVQCGGRCHLGGLLRPVRLHLPGHPVLPVREGLLDAGGRCAHPPVRHLRRRHRAARRPPRPALRAPAGREQRSVPHVGRPRRRQSPRRRQRLLRSGHPRHGPDGDRPLPGDRAGHRGGHELAPEGEGGGGGRGQRHHPGARRHARRGGGRQRVRLGLRPEDRGLPGASTRCRRRRSPRPGSRWPRPSR